MRFPVCILLAFAVLKLAAFPMPGQWKMSLNGQPHPVLETEPTALGKVKFPGSVLAFVERERIKAKPERPFFDSSTLSVRLKLDGTTKPVKAWLFVKDKDGAWFQTEKEYSVPPNEWTVLEARLDGSQRDFRPVGHHAAWNAQFAGGVFSAGVSLYGEQQEETLLRIGKPEFSGSRTFFPLEITDWKLPEKTECFQRIRSTFQLSREYFNPFDPEEISVDFEVELPDGSRLEYPAFYTMDCLKQIHFIREQVRTAGRPYWEIRYIPKKAGVHKIRLRAIDAARTVYSEWKTLEVTASDRKGFVRINRKNPKYFEFETGEPFYSVGLNLHSNTDQRSERAFRFGHLPDRGNVDYFEYIDHMSKAGINLLEVWMASWTCAIEWNISRYGFYGIGRYNLCSAWKLDELLEYAGKHGVYINLVLDNHGKIADVCDPEWHDSPYNSKGIFAAANSAFLEDPGMFWKDKKVKEWNRKRNRYIAARWGAYPEIFAMQQWSEVDLVANAWNSVLDGSMVKFHQETAAYLKKAGQGPHLTATHVCGDIAKVVLWKKLCVDPPQLTHVCSDAYRNPKIPIDIQMQIQQAGMSDVSKPAIVTEYGGSNAGSDYAYQLADIHGGQWSSIFTEQAGTPMLWWHDFVHINNHYRHYRGFADFIQGIDFGTKDIQYLQGNITGNLLAKPETPPIVRKIKKELRQTPLPVKLPEPDLLRGFGLILRRNIFYGWIFVRETMIRYPLELENTPLVSQICAEYRVNLKKGLYILLFSDTLSGEIVSARMIRYSGEGKIIFSVPPLKTDVAFVMRRIK